MKKSAQEVKREIIFIDGLHCTRCAQKIQKLVNKIPGVHLANMDMVTGRLFLDIKKGYRVSKIIEKAIEIAHKTEDGLTITRVEDKEKRSKLHNSSGFSFNEHRNIIVRLIAALMLFGIALFVDLPYYLKISLYIASYLLSGGDVLLKAVRNILKGDLFDENFLMSIATIGAYSIKSYSEATAVMIFYQLGELIQSVAVNKSKKSIQSLLEIRPDYANKISNGEILRVQPEEVGIGNTIIVQPGERIPLDELIKKAEKMAPLKYIALKEE